MPRYEIRNTSNSALTYVEGDLPLDLMLTQAAGTYRAKVMSAEEATDIVVPTLTAGTIVQTTPTIGDTLTVTGSNAPAGATFLWQVDTGGGFGSAGGTNNAASYDTTGRPAGDYRRGVSTAGQSMVYTPAVAVGAAGSGVSYVLFEGTTPTWFDLTAHSMPTSGTAFTIAGKVRAIGTTLVWIATNSQDTHVRINSSRIEVRVEDVLQTALLSTNTGASTMSAGDEAAFIFSANQSGGKLRWARNLGAPSTPVNTSYTTTENLILPIRMNATNGSGGAATSLDVDSIWIATSYLDPDTVWDSFFDGSNLPTSAMRSGSTISSVSPVFAEGGNAAAWNARTGMRGAVTDA
jgi:hypothetical protein